MAWKVPKYGSAAWFALCSYRRRELRKQFPDGMVSDHFRYMEFFTKDGTPMPLRAIPGLQKHCEVYLEELRSRFGPCQILSGYRHEKYNAMIGGAKDSRHIWDNHPDTPATDLIFATGTVVQWAAAAKSIRWDIDQGRGGIGVYPTSGFIHVDRRPFKADWSGR